MTLAIADSAWNLGQPVFNGPFIPNLPSTVLSEEERLAISRLHAKLWSDRWDMLVPDAYYRGEQVLRSLRIALPPELEGLRIVLGWPRMAVDPYVERIHLDCFRLASSDSADDTLTDIWSANGMESELSLAVLDALVKRRGYLTIGSGDDPRNDPPKVCAESPLNLTIGWDLRGNPAEALQTYWSEGARHASLYTPDSTLHICEDDNGQWQVVDRDVHNFGAVPIVRMPNRPETDRRDGSSEITYELMTLVDTVCRVLLNLTVAGEFYAVPQKILLGASESDFLNSDGTPKTAWDTYIGRVLALERDEEGQLPTFQQAKPMDPTVFTKVVETYAGQAAGMMAALPQDLGLYTQGNPTSADSLDTAEVRRNNRARRMIDGFRKPVAEAGKFAMRFVNGGDLPAGYETLTSDWSDPAALNFTGAADGWSKLSAAGMVPSRSDVIRKRLGLSAVERRQMAREDDLADEMLREEGAAIEAKEIRAVNALASAAAPPATPDAPAAPAPTVAPGQPV